MEHAHTHHVRRADAGTHARIDARPHAATHAPAAADSHDPARARSRDAHAGHSSHGPHDHASLDRIAALATLHCLTGCAIGEVAGMVIGTAFGWSNGATILLAVALAFASGFALTALPLLRHGFAPGRALRLALAADTVSIAIMEIVDNLLMLAIPGAMDAPLDSPLFWGSLAGALVAAGIAAYPVNRWMIARGRGHAVVHEHHRGNA